MQTYTFCIWNLPFRYGFLKPCISARTSSALLCIQLGLKHGAEFLKTQSIRNELEAFVFSSELSVLFIRSFLLFTFVQKYSKYLEEVIKLSTFPCANVPCGGDYSPWIESVSWQCSLK